MLPRERPLTTSDSAVVPWFQFNSTPGVHQRQVSMSQEGEERQPTRPVVLPEIFTGEGNLDDWISHFESVAAINKWSDGEKLLWLKVRLTGKAHVAFDQLARETEPGVLCNREESLTRAI